MVLDEYLRFLQILKDDAVSDGVRKIRREEGERLGDGH